jgi:hypothetical protein
VAQRVVLTDDLDGSEATQTLNYTVDGQEYEIDLSEENIQRFHSALEPFVEKSRPVERRVLAQASRRNGRRRSGASRRDDIPQIRSWAEANGYEVSARGRVKKEVLDAYDEAHK